MLVTESLDTSTPAVLTAQEIAEIEEAAKHPVVYDEECPPLTEEQAQRALTYVRESRKIAV